MAHDVFTRGIASLSKENTKDANSVITDAAAAVAMEGLIEFAIR